MPRAAMSVATMVLAAPEWNASMLRVPGALAEIAMQLHGSDPPGVELARQRLGAVLGPGEDERPSGRTGQVGEHRDPLIALTDGARGAPWSRPGLRRIRLMRGRTLRNRLTSPFTAASSVAENSIRWPPRRVCCSSAGHGRQEAEVSHVIGLVEHGDLDPLEPTGALRDQVFEPTGTRDDDVHAVAQAGDLGALADAAVHGQRR